MMDVEVLPTNDDELEDGEVSDTSEEVYTPLQRPISLNQNAIAKIATTRPTPSKCTKMDADGCFINEEDTKTTPLDNAEENCHSDDEDDDLSTSSGDLSDTCLDKLNKREEKKSKHKKRHTKRTVMVRVQQQSLTDCAADQKRARFKKYDIWTAALQEETLTENMRGCDVTQNSLNDRNVENYDFSLKYRLNGESSLKRRLSNSNDDLSDTEQYQPESKRQRNSNCRGEFKSSKASTSSPSRRSIHERLGKRKDFHSRRRSSPYSGGSDSNSYDPKHIEDLTNVDDREPVEIAREMAVKLREEKDDLLVRAVEILGLDLPLKIYKETQRIEAEGGMTIKNGQRRRTPGGVFLFLLKHHESLSAEDQKAIFAENRQNSNKKQKDIKTTMRDLKVEELKKRLCEQVVELPALSSRRDLTIREDEAIYKQKEGNLSNPPPSPEACEHTELDLKSIPINHVTNDVEEVTAEKPSTSHGIETAKGSLQTYEDDVLDVNCGDMDFF